MLVGPLFSTSPRSGAVDFDLKPMIGFGSGTVKVGGNRSTSKTALGLGGTARWNCGNRISLSAGWTYYSAPEDMDLSSLAIVLGINYRFK